MAKADIMAGACGFKTFVTATLEDRRCRLTIESDCKAIQKLASELTDVDPLKEIALKRGMPQTLEMGAKHCIHAACPVPVAIIKTVEVAAGLNLPVDASIKLSK
jgi:hypothetical protein